MKNFHTRRENQLRKVTCAKLFTYLLTYLYAVIKPLYSVFQHEILYIVNPYIRVWRDIIK